MKTWFLAPLFLVVALFVASRFPIYCVVLFCYGSDGGSLAVRYTLRRPSADPFPEDTPSSAEPAEVKPQEKGPENIAASAMNVGRALKAALTEGRGSVVPPGRVIGLTWKTVLARNSPALGAQVAASLWAAKYWLLALLSRHLEIATEPDLRVDTDFEGGQPTRSRLVCVIRFAARDLATILLGVHRS